MSSLEVEDAYEQLRDHISKYYFVSHAGGLLAWDQQVLMPDVATPARAKQMSTLVSLKHDLITDEKVTTYLDALEGSVSAERAAVVREVTRMHDRATSVPRDLVEQITQLGSEAHLEWKTAKEAREFDQFADTLAEMIDLRREYAAAIDPDRDPYAVLVEGYEPYIELGRIEAILQELREELPPLIAAIADSDVELANPFEGTYPVADQEQLVRAALDTVGYDWERGRLDTAPHPFASGTQFDSRITTRFSEDDPLDALSSTLHEFGHASYNLGLPQEEYGTPLGTSRDMVVHESQSRLWENHAGRSLPFWELFTPIVEEHLGVSVTPKAGFEAANRVYEDNRIRVEADELTYHAHILLRYEIERDLIRGDLAVEEVPSVWNDKMDEYLGVRPDHDGEGCLQDIHWSKGAFGYFPTYSLGSMLSAQLFAAGEAELGDLEEDIRAGEFDPLMGWLRESIHRHGCRYTTPELIERASGEALTASYFLEYAQEKYGRLYDL